MWTIVESPQGAFQVCAIERIPLTSPDQGEPLPHAVRPEPAWADERTTTGDGGLHPAFPQLIQHVLLHSRRRSLGLLHPELSLIPKCGDPGISLGIG